MDTYHIAPPDWPDVRERLVKIRNKTSDGQMIFMLHWIIEEGDAQTGPDHRYTQLGRYILLMEYRQQQAQVFKDRVKEAFEVYEY